MCIKASPKRVPIASALRIRINISLCFFNLPINEHAIRENSQPKTTASDPNRYSKERKYFNQPIL